MPRTMSRTVASFSAFFLFLLMVLLTGCTGSSQNLNMVASSSPALAAPTDENIITAVVEIGPFFINSRYESGEGPGRSDETISIRDLVANGKTVWTMPRLGLSVPLAELNSEHPLFKKGLAVQMTHGQSQQNQIGQGNQLYWIRGVKLEVIENGKALVHPEFLCHSIISFDGAEHWRYFPKRSSVSANAMFNFSQGATDIIFPPGYGIPMNENEQLLFDFWTLNRTSDEPRLVTGRWTLYLVNDDQVREPMQALNWYRSGISLLVDNVRPAHHHGMNSMHQPPFRNEKGEEMTQHWLVPPGRHSYQSLHPEHNFYLEGPVIAAGAHLHPFAETMSLIEVTPEDAEKTVFTISSQTNTDGGIKIMNIDYLTWFPENLTLSKNEKTQYGWKVTYNNTSSNDVDAMAGATLYFPDLKFKKPAWAYDEQSSSDR